MTLTEVQVASLGDRLPKRFVDRLPPEALEFPMTLSYVGEWGMLLESLLSTLRRHEVTITSREAQDFEALIETFRLAWIEAGNANYAETYRRSLDSLAVIPSLTKEQLISELKQLPGRMQGRLPDSQLTALEVTPEVEQEGEWEILVELWIRALLRHQVPISLQERNELAMLLDAVHEPRKRLLELPIR